MVMKSPDFVANSPGFKSQALSLYYLCDPGQVL